MIVREISLHDSIHSGSNLTGYIKNLFSKIINYFNKGGREPQGANEDDYLQLNEFLTGEPFN